MTLDEAVWQAAKKANQSYHKWKNHGQFAHTHDLFWQLDMGRFDAYLGCKFCGGYERLYDEREKQYTKMSTLARMVEENE